MRNRFISDWIFEKTGKRRTAKQVGSRLQQLRDTCGGKRRKYLRLLQWYPTTSSLHVTVLKLLSPIRPPSNARTSPVPPLSPTKSQHNNGCPTFGSPSFPYDSESSSDSSVSSPPTPTEAHTALQCLLYRGIEPRMETIPSTIVYIDLVPRQTPASVTGEATWTSSSNAQIEERSWVERGFKVERASQQPRHLFDIDPTITLTSKTPISAQSHFTVLRDDGVVFSETTTLEPLDSSTVPSIDGSFLYRTRLIPGFWETIVHSSGELDFRVYYHQCFMHFPQMLQRTMSSSVCCQKRPLQLPQFPSFQQCTNSTTWTFNRQLQHLNNLLPISTKIAKTIPQQI